MKRILITVAYWSASVLMLRIKSVQGHVYLPVKMEADAGFRMLMLKDMALIRYHKPGAKKSETPHC